MAKKPTYEELEQWVMELEREVTERRANEKILRVMGEAAAASINAIGITDLQGKFIYVNDSCVRMWGYENENQILGRSLPEFWEGAGLVKTVKELQKNGIASGQDIAKRKDGSLFNVQFSANIFKDDSGKPAYMFGAFVDITDRKQAEEEFRRSEEKYLTLLENIEEGYYEVDLAGNFTFLNDAMCRILGESRDGLIGTNNKMVMTPETAKAVYTYFNAVYNTGKPAKNLEWETLKPDGSKRYIEGSAALMKNSEGQPIGFRGVIRDVTERKRMEDDLRQSQKMESIGTLAGGIAHDFNNILGAIIGNAELASLDVPAGNAVKDNLKEILTASMRAKNMVRHILSFARKTSVERKPIQVSTVIKDSLKLMRASIPATIEIRKNILCESEMILADSTEINQVLMNLCTNAVHAMSDGGDVLEVSLKNAELRMKNEELGLEAGRYVKLTVKDTGSGIDPEIMDRIFDPYFTTKDIGKGTGMGLAMVYGIVKKHEGSIKVQSELGKGTVFEVLFPLIEESAEPEVKNEPEVLPTGSERILVVDDEESLVNMMELMLERLGYQVVTKTNPKEALALFKLDQDQFDLVITDMAMPQMAGDRLAQELMESRKDIPILLYTGHSARMDEVRAKELGIKAYALKPLPMRDLAATVRHVLDGE
ncbi:MAG: PAS domain S-box protein [Deltaproteobacteria bacterium]|nr:PAS domain S-box protein [Deltaproteobacteria bacterium]